MIKKCIHLGLLILILCRVSWLIYEQRAKFVPDYWQRYPTLKSVYGESQYMMKGWKYWIPDETVYSYAAGAYMTGVNPILVEPTQPPLGKYLIGLSILLTGNENIIVAVFFVLLIIGIYLLTFQLTANVSIALLTTTAASFQRLFSDQLSSTPLLDIFHITCILYALIVASYALHRRKPAFLLLSYFLFGAALMIKVWLVGVVFMIPVTVYILIKNRTYYLFVIGGFAIMFFMTLLCYTKMFMDGYNLIEVLKVQKWLYWYQAGKQNRLFTIWPLIFLNRWYVWWGETAISSDPNWSVTWPIAIGGGIVSSVRLLMIRLKTNQALGHICALSVFAYSVFMSLGQPSARYLLPVLPICYAVTAWMVYQALYRVSVFKKIL